MIGGKNIFVPQPTPTPTAAPSSTLSVGDATEAACEKYVYTVLATDTLFGISLNFNVPMEAIKEYNGLPGIMYTRARYYQYPPVSVIQSCARPRPTTHRHTRQLTCCCRRWRIIYACQQFFYTPNGLLSLNYDQMSFTV